MAKSVMRARPVEPCRKCGNPVFGRDWTEMDGLCVRCWNKQERNYEFMMDERYGQKNINEDDPRIER